MFYPSIHAVLFVELGLLVQTLNVAHVQKLMGASFLLSTVFHIKGTKVLMTDKGSFPSSLISKKKY